MKAILLILLIPILVCSSYVAKAQKTGLGGISYQAIARTNAGTVIRLQAIQIRFSILNGSPEGTPVYVEKHQTVTSTQGLFTLVIGGGTAELGTFAGVPWANGNQYLKVELDWDGTNNFQPLGVMPFMSVPYALYAANGGSGGGGGGGTVNVIWLGTLATPPATPTAGEAYYNSTDKRSYIYDANGNWNIMAQDGLPGTSLAWLGSFTTEPATPGKNQAYYNLNDRRAYIYDGSAWQVFSESGAEGTAMVWLGTLATAPTAPEANQAYYNSADKKAYIYDTSGTWQILAQDGLDGAQGGAISWLGTLAAAPASPSTNQAYYNSTDRKAYIYDTTGTWQILAQDGTGWNLSALEFGNDGALGLTTTANDTVKSGNRAWLIRGNEGINPAIDFIGTTDDNPFIIKAGGTGPSFERIRTFPDKPQTIINGTDDQTGPLGKAVLTVFSSEVPIGIVNDKPEYPNGIIGYANSGTGAGVAGYNYGNGYGVKGFTQLGSAIYGIATTRFNEGVRGYNSSTSGGGGVYGMTNSPYKASNSFKSAGIVGSSTHASGTGVLGVGNNVDYQSNTHAMEQGSGLMGIGSRIGAAGLGTTLANGIGVAGSGNNQNFIIPITGAGVSGSAGGSVSGIGYPGVGVFGFGTGDATDIDRWGGLFQFGKNVGSIHVYTYLAGANSTGIYGLISNGTKSTVVKDEAGENRLLFCTEAPEVLFQDFGTGELQNGSAHIDLESLLTKVIRVDAKHPMKVFIQLEGECNGVYVTNKSAKGFDVKELQGGKSSVPFTWQIVASRADEVLPDGTVLPYSNRRFPVGPGPMPVMEVKSAPDSTTASEQPALKTVTLKTAEKEVVNKAFSNLQFASAKADIATSSLPSLDKMAALLQAHPEWQLSLSGHTDNEGTEAFNQTLSEKRSEAVKQYLVSKGVFASRITTKGYGQSKPLAANDNKAAKGKNRRVEMEILTEEKP